MTLECRDVIPGPLSPVLTIGDLSPLCGSQMDTWKWQKCVSNVCSGPGAPSRSDKGHLVCQDGAPGPLRPYMILCEPCTPHGSQKVLHKY